MNDETCWGPDGHCITCGDEGISMRVVALSEGYAMCADEQHAQHEVVTDLVEPVTVGDEVLVHAGVAIRNLGAAL